MSVYDALCGELLIDPEQVGREIDAMIIQWHTEHTLSKGAGYGSERRRATGRHAASRGED
jgi:hypothetical protein